jgi:hypothetical protein
MPVVPVVLRGLLVDLKVIGCGNVGISRSVRDFQGAVETVLWFPRRRHFHSRLRG